MGKNRKRKGKSRPGSIFADHNISDLTQHHRQGSALIPPLLRIPNVTLSSWTDDHMPEMLWAVLLTETFDRQDYLACFRGVAGVARHWFLRDEEPLPAESQSPTDSLNEEAICDLTQLALVDDEQFQRFLAIPLGHPLGYAALRPLLLIRDLPGLDRWRRCLGVEPDSSDWNTLAGAVAGVFDHQSDKSTDIRWFKLIVLAISGRLKYPESMSERVEELRLFPSKGDMRKVRPFIRSSEMMIRRNPATAWVSAFWEQVFRETRCIDPSVDEKYRFLETRVDPKSMWDCRDAVIDHFNVTQTAKRVDARLDSAFGATLYGLSLLEEIGMHRIQNRITGRATLRALAEVAITLRYLAKEDDTDLWRSYRVYGAGQAKLAFLKAQQLQGDVPAFLDEEALHAIANEDVWQEYLNIDVGHWADSNLRQLAIDGDAKDLYDRFYDWTSGYIHGNWAAVRDTNFATCHNPLHRLHRIPRRMHRLMNPVESDAVELVNDMVQALEDLFPAKERLPRVQLRPTETAAAQDTQSKDGEDP